MSHLHLMTILEASGPLPMGRVAEMLGSGLPTATGLVTRMQERGLVERTHDTDDRRVVLVGLTPVGEADLRQIQIERARRMALALDHLSDVERTELLSSIRALRVAFARVNQEHGAY